MASMQERVGGWNPLTPLTTFDPRLPQNTQKTIKNYFQPGLKSV